MGEDRGEGGGWDVMAAVDSDSGNRDQDSGYEGFQRLWLLGLSVNNLELSIATQFNPSAEFSYKWDCSCETRI